MEKHNGKTIVITGVTKGIGRALIARYSEQQHTVAGCGRTRSQIQELSKEYPQGNFEEVDITDYDSVMNWANYLHNRIGPPDLLINSASIINRPAPLWKISPTEFENLIKINVIGFWNVIRCFVPGMIAQGSGVIVNVSSGWGRHGEANVGPYCASKFAVEGMTQSLAEELPSGMAAIAFSPGVINTDMLRTCCPDTADDAPSADKWSRSVAPILLKLGPKDNGKSLSARQFKE